MSKKFRKRPPPALPLQEWEEVHYRDRLRAARYAALEDAESFGEICFVIEALGLRLFNRQESMATYEPCIKSYAKKSPLFSRLVKECPEHFTKFESLYETLRIARNDAMHTGAYARHATEAAIELCIGLEDALMISSVRTAVKDVMVKSPVIVESWEPVARARQLMLMHSFSFLPVRIRDKWKLVSELGLAKYLNVRSSETRDLRLAQSIEKAFEEKEMEFVEIASENLLNPDRNLKELLDKAIVQDGPMLWLVLDKKDHLVGILSPFELM